jgi:hypothetical protein
MAKYQGFPSWNAWNVSLWIHNDRDLYERAREAVLAHGERRAARILARELSCSRTEDGATFNRRSIRRALEGMED